MNVTEKVRNAIRQHEHAVRDEIAACQALDDARKRLAESAREVSRQIHNNYPDRAVIYDGRRYQVCGVGIAVQDCDDVIIRE